LLVEAAGSTFKTKSGRKVVQYEMGDMTSVVYPVGGGLEDWAYGAGWDKNKDAALEACDPRTYPLEANFFNKTSLDHIATSIYLIEMDDSKNPPESSYGARMIAADGAV
jgi:hypothetical protein